MAILIQINGEVALGPLKVDGLEEVLQVNGQKHIFFIEKMVWYCKVKTVMM